MSLPARIGHELTSLLRTAVLWVGLYPAISPIRTVVTAAPAVPEVSGWLSIVVSGVAVGWLNYAYPDVSLLRVWVFGFLTSLSLTVFVAAVVGFSTLGSGDGESWALAAAFAACWLCSLGFAVALVSRRVRAEFVARVGSAARSRSE